MLTILLHLLPATLYAALGVHFWRTRWTHRPPTGPQSLSRGERLLVLLALALHGAVLFYALFPGESMHFGFGVAISLMVWLAILFHWIENFYARLDGLQAIAMPAGAVACLIPLLFPAQHALENATSPGFRAHFVIAMLAYSLFTLAALHAMLMAMAERRLHHARLNRALASLPPLLTMESLLFRLVSIAFVLLTLTLLSGGVFSETLFGKAFSLNHKTVFAGVSWVLFGTLLVGRHVWGWRGRVALRWTLAGFVALLLSYVGSRFVIEVLLPSSV